MLWHAATHLLSSSTPHSFNFAAFQTSENYRKLQQRATELSLSNEDIVEYGNRGDPTPHLRRHQAKHFLTKEDADKRIEVVKQLMKISTQGLRRIVFIDEATGPWAFDSS